MKRWVSFVIILILLSTALLTSCQKQNTADQNQPTSVSSGASNESINSNEDTDENYVDLANKYINTMLPEGEEPFKPTTVDYNTLLKRDPLGSRLKLEGVNVYRDTFVDDFQKGDVNGDGILDNVLLTAIYMDGDKDSFKNFINVIIQDGKSRRITFVPSGFSIESSVFLGDFNGDRVKDILVSLEYPASGGAGNYEYNIYSFKDNNLSEIFNYPKLLKDHDIAVDWVDGYMVKVVCTGSDKTFLINIRNKKENNKYHYDGDRLILENNGWADSYCSLFPDDQDNDGVYEITCLQYVCYDFHVDFLGFAETYYKWDRIKQDWVLNDFYFLEDKNEMKNRARLRKC